MDLVNKNEDQSVGDDVDFLQTQIEDGLQKQLQMLRQARENARTMESRLAHLESDNNRLVGANREFEQLVRELRAGLEISTANLQERNALVSQMHREIREERARVRSSLEEKARLEVAWEESLKRSQTESSQKLEEKSLELQSVREQLEKAASVVKDLSVRTERAEESVTDLSEALAQERNARVGAEKEKASLAERLAAFRKALELKDRQNEDLEKKLHRLQEERSSALSSLSALGAEFQQEVEKRRQIEVQIKLEQVARANVPTVDEQVVQSLELQLREEKSEVAKLRENLISAAEDARNARVDLERSKKEMETEREKHEERIRVVQQELDRMKAEFAEKSVQRASREEDLKKELGLLSAKVSETQVLMEELKERNRLLGADQESLRKSLAVAEERARGLEVEKFQLREDLSKSLAVAAENRRKHEAVLEEGRRMAEELSRMKVAEAMVHSKSREVLEASERVRDEARLLDQQKEQQLDLSRRREAQMAEYANLVNRSKQEIRLQAERLMIEMQSMKSLNPLHDYLQVTQREISRVEASLMKTPTISPDRSRLEQCLSELVEQRDYLRGLAQKSSREFDSRLARLKKISQGEALVMTPPPPPGAVGSV